MGAALAALALVAPWLVWLPFVRAPATIDVLGAVAIVGAWHGWGRLVARASRREADAVVTIAWGVAATVALAGCSIALHLYDARLLVIGGTVAHTADLALRWHAVRETEVRASRYWIVPVAIVAIIAVIAVLGAAGQVGARAFDDDGSVIAQIRRLADTGALADAIGYPRAAQLGGHVALAGLVSAFADANRARLVDSGLGLALVLALACTRVRPRHAGAATWLVLLAVAACVFAAPGSDLAPLWLPAALVIALDATLVTDAPLEPRGMLPVMLLAAALAAIRSELAPAGIAFVSGAWALSRTRTRDDVRRALVLFGGFVVVLAPYTLSRALSWHHVDASVRAVVEPPHEGMLVHLVLFTAIAAAAALLALLPLHGLAARTSLRVTLVACAIGVASIAAFGVRPFASHIYWPLAIGGFAVLAIAVAPRREAPAVALVLAMFALVFIHDAQAATARTTSWSWRTYDLMFDVEYARHAAGQGGGYDALLAPVPRGDTVAVWVTRPELLDYARLNIVDLRTPRIARIAERAGELVAGSRARWLLVEDDVPRALDALAQQHRVVASGGRARLVDLR